MAMFALRPATLDDVPQLEVLIATSARELSRSDYTADQIDAALGNAFGVDTELIRDGTYFVVEAAGAVVACGGWSRRRTLFGADGRAGREPALLDPATDAARVRAFFVHPDWARRGIGTALLERCESDARTAGFRSLELMATLPGQRLYEARGYLSSEPIQHALNSQVSIQFVPMRKRLV